MEDSEWVFFEQFILAVRGRGGRPARNHRVVLDGIFWIARTGAQWRDLPEEFGKWDSVYRQFRRWTLAGLWELILEALNDSQAMPGQVQMIDSTIITTTSSTSEKPPSRRAGSEYIVYPSVDFPGCLMNTYRQDDEKNSRCHRRVFAAVGCM